MNRNLNGMSKGMAILCTLGILLFIGLMIDLGTPKCNKSGCDNDARDGSSYVELFAFGLGLDLDKRFCTLIISRI